jgi:hypothetical protein
MKEHKPALSNGTELTDQNLVLAAGNTSSILLAASACSGHCCSYTVFSTAARAFLFARFCAP